MHPISEPTFFPGELLKIITLAVFVEPASLNPYQGTERKNQMFKAPQDFGNVIETHFQIIAMGEKQAL